MRPLWALFGNLIVSRTIESGSQNPNFHQNTWLNFLKIVKIGGRVCCLRKITSPERHFSGYTRFQLSAVQICHLLVENQFPEIRFREFWVVICDCELKLLFRVDFVVTLFQRAENVTKSIVSWQKTAGRATIVSRIIKNYRLSVFNFEIWKFEPPF